MREGRVKRGRRERKKEREERKVRGGGFKKRKRKIC